MPKREDVDPWLRRNSPLCGYCIHSNEQIPDKEQEGIGRLWCEKKQKIVMDPEPAKKCPDYEI